MKTTQVPQPPSAPADDTLFDVRSLPGRTKHGQILGRWLGLPVGSHFVLLNDHDPVPLRYQFDAEFGGAFTWEYLERGPEVFRVKITKVAAVCAPSVRGAASPGPLPAAAAAGATCEVDARGLEPPEPLIRILDALERLPAGAALRARTDREPCHLFGEAERRGFSHRCEAQPDGSWLTLLSRA